MAIAFSCHVAEGSAPPSGPEQLVGGADGLTANSAAAVDGLRLNFRGAPVDVVLDYLSKAAGLIFVSQGEPKGNVDLWSDSPVSKNKAVELLNIALQQSGSAAIQNGRIVTILSPEEAKLHHMAVRLGSDPDQIPITGQLVTQVIPVRFVEVAKLVKDLQPLVPKEATLIANESANSIVVTDKQYNIHKLAIIIKAIDSSAEDPTTLRIFPLYNASPSEMVDLLAELFPDQTSAQDGAPPFPGGGGPGGFPDRGPGGDGIPGGNPGQGNGGADASGSGTQGERLRKRTRVLAVAEGRTSAVAVVAAESMIGQIEKIITELDANPKGKQVVTVLRASNTSPQALKQVLKDIFSKNSSGNSRNDSTSNDPLAARSTAQTQQSQQSSAASRAGSGLGSSGAGSGAARAQ